MTWLYQEQNQQWDLLRNLLKDADNFATHDAAQEIDDLEKSKGRLIIDPVAAANTFKETLRLNLGLDEALQPLPGSRLSSGVKIVDFKILDESTITFPYLYDDTVHKVSKWLYGPAVVAIIQTDHPALLQRPFAQQPIEVPAIYEYKPNE
jgi:hypothetical protein